MELTSLLSVKGRTLSRQGHGLGGRPCGGSPFMSIGLGAMGAGFFAPETAEAPMAVLDRAALGTTRISKSGPYEPPTLFLR